MRRLVGWYNLRGLSTSGVTVPVVAVQPREATSADVSWRDLGPLLVPCGLLIVGGLIGFPFSLDPPVAAERLLGLLAASALALGSAPLVARLRHPANVLLGAAAVSLLGGVWIISASGPDIFRGGLGHLFQVLFGPVFGLARVTDPVGVANARFIVGYNGLIDLCAVEIFCCAAVVLDRRQWRSPKTIGLLVAIALGLLLLVAAGARGGLTGLAAGVCLIALYAWPRRFALLGLLAVPIALGAAAVGLLDKGVEFSSTAGRLTYWSDLVRLLTEYPLTGTGLGVDTAYRVSLLYEINPDPERVFYAHNTFVQSDMELGPLGALGMLLVPLAAVAAALVARRCGVAPGHRAVLVASLGVVGALTAHGLTDQVVTTNVGTGILLMGLSGAVAALSPPGRSELSRLASRALVGILGLVAIVAVGFAAAPAGRAQALLDLGGLQANQALAMDVQDARRPTALASAEQTLSLAQGQASNHPAILRELARVRSARFDDAGALDALQRATRAPGLDAFDTLQIAHVYRDLGFAQEAYALASRAYAAWGRSTEDAVMQTYAQSTLAVLDDFRARTLAEQAEAAMRARHFGEAVGLFEQALTFQPESGYLQDRLGAAQRAVAKYGG